MLFKTFQSATEPSQFLAFYVSKEVLLDGSEEEVERYTLQDGLSSPLELNGVFVHLYW